MVFGDNISPLDGRYEGATRALAAYFSENALLCERVRIEYFWLAFLLKHGGQWQAPWHLRLDQQSLAATLAALEALATDIDTTAIKALEIETKHDVKACEYYCQQSLRSKGVDESIVSLVHFAATSEDINNLAYARLQKGAWLTQLRPALITLVERLGQMAQTYKNTAMLSHTHGQPASPTTFGKELGVFHHRLSKLRLLSRETLFQGKFNGTVGNFHTHHFALPNVNWPETAREFVEGLGLSYNPITTQIESHDALVSFCLDLHQLCGVLTDLARDLWQYVSLGYLSQHASPMQVGSSTMPHKVNPIDFENAEGNLGMCQSIALHFANKLPISRLQRDLSDSTTMRYVGTMFAHALLAIKSLHQGLGKITPHTAHLREDLSSRWELLAEPLQTLLRCHGFSDGYERLRKLTQGQLVTKSMLHTLLESYDLPVEQKARFFALTPDTYLGLASTLVTA